MKYQHLKGVLKLEHLMAAGRAARDGFWFELKVRNSATLSKIGCLSIAKKLCLISGILHSHSTVFFHVESILLDRLPSSTCQEGQGDDPDTLGQASRVGVVFFLRREGFSFNSAGEVGVVFAPLC